MTKPQEDGLAMMHATVALVLLMPFLLSQALSSVSRAPAPPSPAPVQPSDQPPIITISEADGFTFPSGSAELSSEVQRRLSEVVVPRLVALASRYRCDVVEVIGHTDSRAVKSPSNLDRRLDARAGATEGLVAGSNTDLGLLRAWAVATYLRTQPGLNKMRFYGYSAGQTVLPNGDLAGSETSDDSSRRRIEVRLRRSR